MYGNARFAMAGALLVLTASGASAFQAKGPPAGTVGQSQGQPPTTQGQPPAAAGQSQGQPPATKGQPPGTVGQSQIQPPAIQPPTTQGQLPGTAGQSQSNPAKAGQGGIFQPQAGQQGGSPSGVSQTPWFSDPGVQKHLNLTQEQSNQLTTSYGQSLNNYNMGLQGLDKLSDQQRAARMQELFNGFNKGVVDPAGTILNPQQLQRFNQLHLQNQGYGAFNNPEIQQKLKLTNDQSVNLRQYEQQYNQKVNDILKGAVTDPQGAAKQYEEFRRQNSEQINSMFTPQQVQMWREMTGDLYSFPPNQNGKK
jgi:hypothetical protein